MSIQEADSSKPLVKPLVSVIIPVYNGERFLAETLRSVLEQTYSRFEIVVVDDGSTDGTARVAGAFPGVRCLSQPNQGHGAAKNAGASAACGEFLAFLDADDLWLPDKLQRQVAHALLHEDTGLVLCYELQFLQAGLEAPKWWNPRYASDPHPCFLPSAWMVRRSAFERVGPFSVDLLHGNDQDWILRARHLEINIAIIPEVLLLRRIHGGNRSHELKESTRDVLSVAMRSIKRKRQPET